MELALPDVAVVGHFAVDTLLLPNRQPVLMLGGSVAYVSLVARRLEANVKVVSRVGGDFPEDYMRWLKREGVELSGVVKHEAEKTTRFELAYSIDLSERKLKLKSRGSPLAMEELPADLRAKAIHIAPIDGEISIELIENLRRCTDVLSLDPQGMLRKFDDEGNVLDCSMMDASLLDLVDVYKSSLNEIRILTGQSDLEAAMREVHDHGVKTVLVTMGGKGAVLSAEEAVYNIPACKPEALLDPTGAGDAFIGGFLTELSRNKDAFWSACVGSAAASFVVEGLGPTCLGRREEIYKRAETIYEK
jgi:sugar/nucleoside kinase (ribokinase family)